MVEAVTLVQQPVLDRFLLLSKAMCTRKKRANVPGAGLTRRVLKASSKWKKTNT